MNSIRKHPFAVEAHFRKSVVLTFAIPKEELQAFLPPCLELDTYGNKFGFIAVAMVDTKNLRPKGVPKFMGNDFSLIGYRIFVKYINRRGKRLRGLYIIKSETNSPRMKFFGNFFTKYQYTTTDISMRSENGISSISSEKSNFALTFEESDDEVKLPPNSPFPEWKIARRYAGPLPFTFTFDAEKDEVIIIEGVRKDWKPKPIKVIDQNFSFFKELAISTPILANAFVINNIPYYWKKGKIESWNG